jgi:MFS family permease
MVTPPARTARRAVLGALAIVTAGQFPAFLTGALAVQIARDLAFSASGLGIAVGAFFVTSALGSAMLGRLVERVGWRSGMLAGAAATFASLFGVALAAHSWGMLVGLLALGGLGNAISQPAANLSLTRMVPSQRQGLVFGVKQSAIPVATLIGGLSVPAIALTVGWRWTYVAAAAGALLAAITVAPDPDPDPEADLGPTTPTRLRRLPSTLRPLIFVSIAGGLGASVGNSLGTFLVTTAVESGVGEHAAGLLLGFGSVVGLTARVLGGWAADRRPFRPLLAVGALLTAGTVGCLMIASLHAAILVVGTMLAFGAGWGWPGLFNLAVVRDYFSAPAMATGVTQTGVYVGAGLGPVIFGLIADHGGYHVAWIFTAGVALAAAATSFYGEHEMAVTRAGPAR